MNSKNKTPKKFDLSIANDDTDEAEYEATKDNMPVELSRYFDNKDDEYIANKIILKPYIIYPEYMHKIIWDIFMSFILVLSCVLTPVDLAFPAIRD